LEFPQRHEKEEQAGTNAPDHQTMSGKKIEMFGKNNGVPDHFVWCSVYFYQILANFY
jgi:hypothetical protein